MYTSKTTSKTKTSKINKTKTSKSKTKTNKTKTSKSKTNKTDKTKTKTSNNSSSNSNSNSISADSDEKKLLNKTKINKILKEQNYKIERIIETLDDNRGTNYLCEKITKIKVKVSAFKTPIEYFNYNTLDDEDEIPTKSDVYLEIPQDFFDDKSQFFGLYKIEARPITKRFKKNDRPVWNLWAESFPHFSFDINTLEIPGTKEIISGRSNPYSYYTMFKSISPFIPLMRFGIYKPYLVSNSEYKIEEGDEYELIFYDYVVLLTDDIKKTNYLLLSK